MIEKSSLYTTLVIVLALLGIIAVLFGFSQGSRINP